MDAYRAISYKLNETFFTIIWYVKQEKKCTQEGRRRGMNESNYPHEMKSSH